MALEGLDINQRILDGILKHYEDDIMRKAITIIALGKLQLERHEGTEHFVPGNAIRLLPAHCQIRVDPKSPSSVPEYYPDFTTLPKWEEIVGPHMMVGTLHGDIPISTKRHRNPALEEQLHVIPFGTWLYIRPRLTKPFYEFIADGFALDPDSIKRETVYFSPSHADPKSLTRDALSLLKQRKALFDSLVENEWSDHMRVWRCERRQWELTLIENEWMQKEQSIYLPLGLGIDNLVDARRHIEIENAKERAGLISPFEIGLREREKTQPYDKVIKEMADLTAAIKELEKMLIQDQD
ncbi:hypothetical protein N7486_007183 [Penicillium sp. IBT 16267x]|nr:hypothetical protein N7486_007183 [Penicillium sp. IBT 16267x]